MLTAATYECLNRTDHTTELQFALDCLRCGLDGMPVAEVPPSFSADLFLDVLRFNKATLLAAKGLKGAKGVPPQVSQAFQAIRLQVMQINGASLRASLSSTEALAAAGVSHLLFKGSIQQQALYGELFAKPSKDADLLVSAADYPKAREALARIGWTVSGQSRSVWWSTFLGEQHLWNPAPGAATVDLHFRLQQPGSPSPRDVAAFLRRRVSLAVAGRQLPVMSVPDMLLLAAISVVKALFNRQPCAGYACDIHAARRLLDSDQQAALLQRAGKEGLEGTLLLGARASDALLRLGKDAISARASAILPQVSDETLRNMVAAPWLPHLRWPERRSVLWELCGRAPRHFTVEAGWAALAEVSRRVFEGAAR